MGTTYVLERELGGGGMSHVFLATETALDRKVVIKLFPADLGRALSVERFRQEIRLAAKLQNPHIVPLLSAGEAGGQPYYTMPFIEGSSLRARLTQSAVVPLAEATGILRDLARALQYAHDHGVVHRDIKPENILLSGGSAVVTDFGVAKAVEASATQGGSGLTTLGVALGTPAYMAPEQAAADPMVDQRADLYAFGCVAYEVLTGASPFAGRTPAAALAAHIAETPADLSDRPWVPPPLAALVMRCLRKNPAERPQTAGEILQILETTPSVAAEPVAAPGRRRVFTRGRAVMAGALALAVLAVGVAVARRRPPPALASSAKVIAVLPFVPAGQDTALTRLGRDLVVTLSANLDGVADLSTTDAQTILARAGAGLSADQVGAMARQLGARSALRGNLVRVGDRIRADAELVSADSLRTLARVSATATGGDISALTDSLTWTLLRALWQTGEAPSPSVAAVTTHSVPALRAFLDGERLSAAGRFATAGEAYGQAIEADSAFWLAYQRLVWTRGFTGIPVPPRIDSLLRVSYRKLPERERAIYEAEHADSVSESIDRLRAVVERYPEHAPAWQAYGDRMTHVPPLLGHTLSEARAPLERTLALRSRNEPMWEHLLWTQLREDSAASGRSIDTIATLVTPDVRAEWIRNYGASPVEFYRLIVLGQHGRDASSLPVADTLLRSMSGPQAPSGRWTVLPAVLISGFGAPRTQIGIDRRALRLGVAPVNVPLFKRAIAMAWLERGAWDSSFVTMADQAAGSDADPRWSIEAYEIAGIGEWLGALDSSNAVRARPTALRAVQRMNRDAQAHGAATIRWVDGLRAAAGNDKASLAAARAALETDSAGTSYARSLASFALALDGRTREAGQSLAAFEWHQAEHVQIDPALIFVDRLAASRWLAAAGDLEQASRLLTWVDALREEILGAPVSLTLTYLQRAEIEAARGRADLAKKYYAEFLDVYDQPGPRQAKLVADAKASLAKLQSR